MRLGILQLNPTIGALEANAARIARGVRALDGADLCVTSEMSLPGYPPRDLLLHRAFVARCREVVDHLAADLASASPVLIGLPIENRAREGRPLFNAAVLLRRGRVERVFRKALLPTYDVFDEDRYFEPGPAGANLLDLGGLDCAVSICEDIWNDRDFWQQRRYHRDPIEEARLAGADLVINMSASPFATGKLHLRERMLADLARRHAVPVLYVNQVGGNDDLVFDGRSLFIDAGGRIRLRAKAFDEDLLVVDTEQADADPELPAVTDGEGDIEEVYHALVLGLRDYARKCGFTRALLGLSGGIDSALVATIAVDALGAGQVTGVLMPSPYSSEGSVSDSLALAAALGLRTTTLPIGPLMEAFDRALAQEFAGLPADVTEENIQARIRGNLLMAIANKTGALLLSTGNKSELAVGYCTLYGDMSGGLAVIADVPKTMVYRLAAWVNARRPLIPQAILTKPPSAELRPGQTDQDSLPPYDVLDRILERHIEDHESAHTLIEAGFDPATVAKVVGLVRVAEFKRKQAAPGIKVTDRAFGSGWRMPIARGDWEPPLV